MKTLLLEMLALALTLAPVQVAGEFVGVSSLIDAPTAQTLVRGDIQVSVSSSFGIYHGSDPAVGDAGVAFGLLDCLELNLAMAGMRIPVAGLTASSLRGRPKLWPPAVFAGIDGITKDKKFSSLGADKTWRDVNVFEHRNSERYSAYLGLYLGRDRFSFCPGVGRGRFVGYGSVSGKFNSDFFLGDQFNDDALGFFWSLRTDISNTWHFDAEYDGRDVNVALQVDKYPFELSLGLAKIEHITTGELELGPRFCFGLRLHRRWRENGQMPDSVDVSFIEQSSTPTAQAHAAVRSFAESLRRHYRRGMPKPLLISGYCNELYSHEQNDSLAACRALAAESLLRRYLPEGGAFFPMGFKLCWSQSKRRNSAVIALVK